MSIGFSRTLLHGISYLHYRLPEIHEPKRKGHVTGRQLSLLLYNSVIKGIKYGSHPIFLDDNIIVIYSRFSEFRLLKFCQMGFDISDDGLILDITGPVFVFVEAKCLERLTGQHSRYLRY